MKTGKREGGGKLTTEKEGSSRSDAPNPGMLSKEPVWRKIDEQTEQANTE